MAKAKSKTVRDARIDQVGFFNALGKQHVYPLKDSIKADLEKKNAKRCEGDHFDGVIVPQTVSVTDPGKFLKRFEDGKMTRKQFLAAISVRREDAGELMSAEDLNKMSRSQPGTPQLRAFRKGDVPIELVDAIKGLGEAIK